MRHVSASEIQFIKLTLVICYKTKMHTKFNTLCKAILSFFELNKQTKIPEPREKVNRILAYFKMYGN